ncbi:DUF839 domain-containing protein [Bermanella marisrubri]|uniref:Cell surface protein n=1 Tax=Bermanella marisrubri TaxID=207949 RepID=Q1MYW1_9GAMM|nr:alkaline phosphatase PhoX [Bermanella marisrubri]EAT11180.1 hypothetical protein RED65_07844 [Oceanobacter sp. RED65] [Bermanella marisrubri]QIZ83371.1 DUF839 domain-containing protein [Bermanella marisrubri]
MNKKVLSVAIASAVMLTACGSDDDASNNPKRLATLPLGSELTGMFVSDSGDFFFNVQHPSNSLPGDESKAAVGVWVGVDMNNLDKDLELKNVPELDSAEAKTTVVAKGEYQVLGREGDNFSGDLPFGLGNITNAAEDADIKQSNDPDFNAFIATKGDGSEGYLFTAWEDRPGGMSRIKLSKNEDGSWNTDAAMNIDFSNVNGTMINCFGTLSPWNTPLTSEENYEAENTANWNNANYENGYPSYSDVQNIQTYLGGTYPNPYDYGYIVEVTEATTASPVPVKHFTTGRSAHENPVIMPDNMTVYLTDDGSDKAFYKLVTDNPNDLSSGTLYAAKLTQDENETDSAKAGFDIEWIELASANNAEIEQWIREYDGIDEADYVEGENDYISEADITAWANGEAADDRVAFLETLKAAKAKGATVEFTKMEGININYNGLKDGSVPYMYVAMSDVKSTMADTEGDIQVTENRCGIVYRFVLDENYNATRMEPVVSGGPYDSEAAANACSVNGIANPDNIVVLNDGRVLIGEDTSKHENNMLWVYTPEANN